MLAKSTAGCSSYIQRRFEADCRASILWSDRCCGQPSVCPLLLGLCDLLQRALSQSSRSSGLWVPDKGTGNACRDTAFAGGRFSTLDLANLAAITGALRNLSTRHTEFTSYGSIASQSVSVLQAPRQALRAPAGSKAAGAFGSSPIRWNLNQVAAVISYIKST